jgi:type IV conjugative transfer system protein TraE
VIEEQILAENERLTKFNNRLFDVVKYVSIALIGAIVVIYYQATHEKIVIVPPGFELKERATIGVDNASQEYLQTMSGYITQRVMNVTPSNVDKSLESVLYLIHPDYYAKYRVELLNQAKSIKLNNISQSFSVQATEYEKDRIIVRGIASQKIGQNYGADVESVLEIKYTIENRLFRLLNVGKFQKREYDDYRMKEKQGDKK